VRLLAREPVAVFFSLVFPLVILAFIGSAYADEEIKDGVRFIEVMFPALLGTVAANITTMGLPIYFGELRARGVLKRYRSLPVPGWLVGVAIEGSLVLLLIVSAAVVSAAVGIFYGLRITAISPLFLLLMLGLVTWLSCVGFVLGALPVKTRTVQSISAAVFFLMFFGSGYAAPIDGLPSWLQFITSFNPLRFWFDALTNVYLGDPISGGDVGKLMATLVGAALTFALALRLYGAESNG